MNILVTALTTCLGVGFFPAAPGTAATIVGIFLAFFLQNSFILYIAVTLLLLGIAIPACSYMEKQLNQKDPGILVIDEVVGVMIAFLGLPLTWPVAIVGFFLFRAFDMFKIYPINRLEALPGGLGIMLDDVMAGFYTNIALHIAFKYAGLI
jgi:phosphatidylglycerophosphatase A